MRRVLLVIVSRSRAHRFWSSCRSTPSVETRNRSRARAESRRADRSHRLLGVDRHAGLALAHGDAEERRLPGHSYHPAARKVADAWDPAKDEAAGEQCKSYGAPALMSVPGRIHITWQDDNTLKVDTDAGTQTRLLRFGAAQTHGQHAARPGRASRRRSG